MTESSRYGQLWNRQELVLALELYCRIPFAKTKATNPSVRQLAAKIDRTPASVARKLGNFGAFDPELRKRNISGLGHGSHLDEELWNEFNNDWTSLVSEAHKIKSGLRHQRTDEPEMPLPSGPSERERIGKQRLHQAFFRQAVLSSYGSRCAITGISIPECLIASHIVPWSESAEARANPMNGICLSATMDRLFDFGLITFTEKLRVQVSPRVLDIRDEPVQRHIASYDRKRILRPERFLPKASFLEWHRFHLFQHH